MRSWWTILSSCSTHALPNRAIPIWAPKVPCASWGVHDETSLAVCRPALNRVCGALRRRAGVAPDRRPRLRDFARTVADHRSGGKARPAGWIDLVEGAVRHRGENAGAKDRRDG